MGLATQQPSPPPRVFLPWWRRRPFARPPEPTAPPLAAIARDLHRLETEAQRLLDDCTVVARGQRLIAVRQAYDLVLLDASRALDVPVPREHVPFTHDERFMTTVALTAAGLRW